MEVMASNRPSIHNSKSKDLIRWAKEHGYTELPSRGKGSHVRMVREGSPAITIPVNGRGHVGRNVVRSIIKAVEGK